MPARNQSGSVTASGAKAAGGDGRDYAPVRRLAIFIEQSLHHKIRQAVFENNNEQLWSEIRSSTEAIMQQLYEQGEFGGATRRKAYFVKCDAETNTQADIDSGLLNIVVGYAPSKPAEFVIIRIQEMMGQQQQQQDTKPKRKRG